jgi:hypothetical protein
MTRRAARAQSAGARIAAVRRRLVRLWHHNFGCPPDRIVRWVPWGGQELGICECKDE